MQIYNRNTMTAAVGTEIGVSDWLLITPDMVNQFAALTRDPVELHTNVELAKQTPFGGTIAHSLFTLSLIGGLTTAAPVLMESIAIGLGYDFDKVRFLTPTKPDHECVATSSCAQ